MAVLDGVAWFCLTDKLPEGMRMIRMVMWLLERNIPDRTASAKALGQEVLGTARRPEWLEWRKPKRVE